MSLRLSVVAAVGACSLCAGAAQAVVTLNANQTLPVSQILNSQDKKFIIGDKLFTVLSYTGPTAIIANTDLAAFISTNPLDGIGFDLQGPFADTTAGDGLATDIVFRYTVEVVPQFAQQGFRIVDNTLAFNGAASGTGSYARVDESILSANGLDVLAQTQVYANAGPPATQKYSDRWQTTGGGFLKLEVVKDIQFKAEPAGGTATASFVRQAFSQVPAPGSAALLGAAGLVALRRRR